MSRSLSAGPTAPASSRPQDLAADAWRPLAAAHAAAAQHRTQRRLDRRAQGKTHPVEDFLFEYYNHRPAHFARWHPDPGVGLIGAAERADWAFYTWDGSVARLKIEEFLERRGRAVEFVTALLRATLDRPARLGCFGLHEWAMVYRADEEQIRHQGWPLRLGSSGTDAVVEGQRIACSHADAFRFFTEPARERNTLQPTRETQLRNEQPGCLHAGMDLYKWSFKLSPLIPSRITLAAFDLAYEIRELDMRAAPYDLSELGYTPVRIETAEGRAEYAAAQRGFAERSNGVRRDILAVLESAVLERFAADDR